MDVHFFSWNLYGSNGIYIPLPSGKRLQKTNWKITMLLMGKSTISMAIFNRKLFVYQRVIFNHQIFKQQNWWFFLDITNQN